MECDKNHPHCRYTLSGSRLDLETKLPSRVLDIGRACDTVRLKVMAGQCAKYVALSHCWGGKSQVQTTRASFEDHKRGISLHKLSKTIRDAIWVARKLEIRYLWIDSLCIIQDDE